MHVMPIQSALCCACRRHKDEDPSGVCGASGHEGEGQGHSESEVRRADGEDHSGVLASQKPRVRGVFGPHLRGLAGGQRSGTAYRPLHRGGLRQNRGSSLLEDSLLACFESVFEWFDLSV